MSSELWQRIRETLTAAMKTSAASGPDRELWRELESLLCLAEESGDRGGLPPPPAHGQELVEGSRIGPYRILRCLASGDMGVIYLACRADQDSQRQVAIKVVKNRASRDMLLLFRHERQILAPLDHPNVSRLLDSGTTKDGLPYFVMEYIDGEPIDCFCDRRRLAIRERLELFCKVCSAVHFLHQNLVLHLDLCPSNILVNADGEPWLVDFGIAKLMGAETMPLSVLAAHGPVSLHCASPEQVQVLTVATDVYALGVLLYQLLTGHHPTERARSLKDRLGMIRDQEPERPSHAVRRTAQVMGPDGSAVTLSPESVSATREGDPAALERRLAGDLDSIVLKALAKEPALRHASAEHLADDLRRYLADDPLPAGGSRR